MLELAFLAGSDLKNLFLPAGWNLIKTFELSFFSGGTQGYFATGALPSSGETVAVLAVGIPWDPFISFYLPSFHTQIPFRVRSRATNAENLDKYCRHMQEILAETRHLGAVAEPGQAAARGLNRFDDLRRSAARAQAGMRTAIYDCIRGGNGQRAGRQLTALTDEVLDHFETSQMRLENVLEGKAICTGSGVFQGQEISLADRMARAQVALQQTNTIPQGPQIDLGYSILMDSMREPMRKELDFTANLPEFKDAFPVLVTGINTGAPLSQLAALDIRPGNNESPVTAISAYSFSNPAYGNQTYSEDFLKALPGAFRVTSSIDLFPSAPTPAQNYVPSGVEETLNVPTPKYASPWLERTKPWYEKGFAAARSQLNQARGQASQAPVPRAPLLLPPAVQTARTNRVDAAAKAGAGSYDPNLAFTLSLCTTVANQRFMRPGLPIAVNTSPFDFNKDITAAGVKWAVGYASNTDQIAVAFRDTVSWLELIDVVVNANLSLFPYGGDRSTFISLGIKNLYAALRTELRIWLTSQPLAAKEVLFTGHGAGGALAALAALDFYFNPPEGAKGVAAVYSLGGTPLGGFNFAALYDEKLAQRSFMVNRPLDVLPQLTLQGGYESLQTTQPLPGGTFDPFNTFSFHPIYVYNTLLDPIGESGLLGGTRMSPYPNLPSPIREHMQRIFEYTQSPWQKTRPGVASSDQIKRISWVTERSDLPPILHEGNHKAHYSLETMVVKSGHPLVFESPFNEPLFIHIGKLVVEPGSVIQIEGPVTCYVGLLQSGQEESYLRVIAADGCQGTQGAPGPPGVDGSRGSAGGAGGNGSRGNPGSAGLSTQDVTFYIYRVEGILYVEQNPGNGGAGGSGGQGGRGGRGGPGANQSMGWGGNGGNGGSGSNGASGGDGATVTIIYEELTPNARFEILNQLGLGGAPGAGGQGGIPGLGHPDGTMGSPGTTGSPGSPGKPGKIIIRKK